MILVERLIIAIMAIAAVSGPSSAQSIAATVERWGLLGTWAVDCSQPPAEGRLYHIYVKNADGVGIVHYRDHGNSAATDASVVHVARLLPNGDLELAEDPKDPFTWVSTKDGNRIRAMNAHGADGKPTVLDGRFTFNGAQTPWQNRCR